MSIIEQLERDLEAAAATRYPRRGWQPTRLRMAPVLAASAVALLLVAVLAGRGDDRRGPTERSLPFDPAALRRLVGPAPASGSLDQIRRHFAIFRRPQESVDRVPGTAADADPSGPQLNTDLTRRLASNDRAALYAAPVRRRDDDEICMVMITADAGSSACAPVATAIDQDHVMSLGLQPQGETGTEIFTMLMPDSVDQVSVRLVDDTELVAAVRNNAVLVRAKRHVLQVSWTDTSGRQHVQQIH
jgi:hypothetical protein